MPDVPSKYAVQRVQYGEGRKFLTPIIDMVQFFDTREKAVAEIEKAIKGGAPNAQIVLLKVEALYHAQEIEVAYIDA